MFHTYIFLSWLETRTKVIISAITCVTLWELHSRFSTHSLNYLSKCGSLSWRREDWSQTEYTGVKEAPKWNSKVTGSDREWKKEVCVCKPDKLAEVKCLVLLQAGRWKTNSKNERNNVESWGESSDAEWLEGRGSEEKCQGAEIKYWASLWESGLSDQRDLTRQRFWR